MLVINIPMTTTRISRNGKSRHLLSAHVVCDIGNILCSLNQTVLWVKYWWIALGFWWFIRCNRVTVLQRYVDITVLPCYSTATTVLKDACSQYNQCILKLYSQTVISNFTLKLYSLTVLSYCTLLLYPQTILSNYTLKLYYQTVLSNCTLEL